MVGYRELIGHIAFGVLVLAAVIGTAAFGVVVFYTFHGPNM